MDALLCRICSLLSQSTCTTRRWMDTPAVCGAENAETTKIHYVLLNTVSVKSFCPRSYKNFTVWCTIRNFRYRGNKRQSIEQISVTSLNCPPTKTYYLVQDLRLQLYISFITKVAASFVLKFLNFRYCGNKGRSGEKLEDTVKLNDSINRRSAERLSDITHTWRVNGVIAGRGHVTSRLQGGPKK